MMPKYRYAIHFTDTDSTDWLHQHFSDVETAKDADSEEDAIESLRIRYPTSPVHSIRKCGEWHDYRLVQV